jgi:hypothetical protein
VIFRRDGYLDKNHSESVFRIQPEFYVRVELTTAIGENMEYAADLKSLHTLKNPCKSTVAFFKSHIIFLHYKLKLQDLALDGGWHLVILNDPASKIVVPEWPQVEIASSI